jgi:hypothetical protein
MLVFFLCISCRRSMMICLNCSCLLSSIRMHYIPPRNGDAISYMPPPVVVTTVSVKKLFYSTIFDVFALLARMYLLQILVFAGLYH